MQHFPFLVCIMLDIHICSPPPCSGYPRGTTWLELKTFRVTSHEVVKSFENYAPSSAAVTVIFLVSMSQYFHPYSDGSEGEARASSRYSYTWCHIFLISQGWLDKSGLAFIQEMVRGCGRSLNTTSTTSETVNTYTTKWWGVEGNATLPNFELLTAGVGNNTGICIKHLSKQGQIKSFTKPNQGQVCIKILIAQNMYKKLLSVNCLGTLGAVPLGRRFDINCPVYCPIYMTHSVQF